MSNRSITLENFNPTLSKKKQIILLTKSDLLDIKGIKQKVLLLKKIQPVAIPVSILDQESWNKVKELISL